MDKKVVISKLLKAYQAKGSSFMEAGAGAAWMFQAPTFQADINRAILAWTRDNDPSPIQGVVMAMQTYGILSAEDVDTFLQNIEDAGGE